MDEFRHIANAETLQIFVEKLLQKLKTQMRLYQIPKTSV